MLAPQPPASAQAQLARPQPDAGAAAAETGLLVLRLRDLRRDPTGACLD